MSELVQGFEITQALAAQRDGQPQRNGSLRVAVPVSVIQTLLAKSESYMDQRHRLAASGTTDDIVARGTATHRLCWCAPTSDCVHDDEFSMDAGALAFISPEWFQNRTCTSSQPCEVPRQRFAQGCSAKWSLS